MERMKNRLRPIIIIFIVAMMMSLMTYTANAQDRRLTRDKNTQAGKRLALVIGNGAYRNTSVLKNPVNDATDMARALRTQNSKSLRPL